jgi:hypothetical protein
MPYELTKIEYSSIPHLSVATAISKCFVFLVTSLYARTYCSIMYGLYNIQMGTDVI